MTNTETSIIIVNYNTASEIKNCLSSVLASNFKNYEIIVVDNDSTDNSVEVIKKFPEVRLIQNNKNLGFSQGNNIGARKARGDFFFFLNPDAEVEKDAISELLQFSKKNKNSILGPRILNPNGSVQDSCYNSPTILGAIAEYWLGKAGAYEKFAPKMNKPVKVGAIVGAAMFMSKQIFEKLGGFNERYFLYYEDLDLCRKAQALKIPVFYYPAAVIIHGLGKAGGSLEHLKKSAVVYHGLLKYFVITFVIKISQWLKF